MLLKSKWKNISKLLNIKQSCFSYDLLNNIFIFIKFSKVYGSDCFYD